jgi:hypothetical protein
MHQPQIVPFLIHVAMFAAGVVALSFLFATLGPWVQRHLSGLLKDFVSKKPS